MLLKKTRQLKTQQTLCTGAVSFCLVAVTIYCLQESASTVGARNKNAQASTTTAPQNSKDSEAQEAFARGEALCSNWTATSFRQAIDQYEKAALLWTSVSDSSKASEATLRGGDVYFLLSEYAQALERYQKAEALAKETGDWLVQATALSQTGRLHSYLGDNDLAQKQLSLALDLFEEHATNHTTIATNRYGDALSNLAEVSYAKGNFYKASQQLESALNAFQNDPQGEARVHLLQGQIAGSIGEIEKAGAEIFRALDLYREANDKRGEGLALNTMGLWYSGNNNPQSAIEMADKAREIFREIGDSRSEGLALNTLGETYRDLAEYSNALPNYMNALALFEKIGATDGASAAAYSIAWTQLLSGNPDQALTFYQRCLQLSRAAGNRRLEAYALKGIADSYRVQERRELASAQYQKSEDFFKSIGDLRGQAMALNSHGDFFLQVREPSKALNLFTQAFSLSEEMGNQGILIATLYNLAQANEALGLHEVALSLITRSFELIEEIRSNVASPDFRASYFAAVGKHYDLFIEILMQLDKLRPGQGFADQAFSVSEQARARLLLDLLSESRPNMATGAAKDLVETERRLRGLIRAQAEYQLSLSLSGKDSTELTEVADQIARLRAEYQSVQAKLRKQSPRLFSFEQFTPVNLERIQKELRGSDTILLEYALGGNQSYLWAVTSDSSDSYVLPARKEIEDAASEFWKIITARQESERDYPADVETADSLYSEKASKLSQMLLAPVAEKLRGRRIVVVTDGVLQYIPFEALPAPSASTTGPVDESTLLIATNEVSVLPSASTLIAIRGAQNHKDSPGKTVTIIADPVFSANDDRIKNAGLTPDIAKAAVSQTADQAGQPISKLSLARLAHTSEEADAISDVAPWGSTLMAKGFEASRETAMSGNIQRSQIIHFATHAFFNDKHPELSGIVLTMMDRNGESKNGLMPLPDIYSLDLSAELVVLSACQTALGKDVKGEGLVGLTHSFISAGAKSVVASLWNVDDRATAVLMAEFYKGMLQDGMTPSAALRSAKLKMMKNKQWHAPYYWAGFVVQGEYANHITVARYAWLRPAFVILFVLIVIAVTLLILQRRKQRIPQNHST